MPRRPLSPRVRRGKAFLPSVKPVRMRAEFLGNYLSGLAAGEPVLHRFRLERFLEFTTGFDRGFCDGFYLTWLT
jgi:hypothetical protein